MYPNLINDFGGMLENIVYTHLKIADHEIKIGSGNNNEIDFITSVENKKQYIQVSYILMNEQTINREFGTLENIKDNLPKYVVSMDDLLINNDKGIQHKQVWDFVYDLSKF